MLVAVGCGDKSNTSSKCPAEKASCEVADKTTSCCEKKELVLPTKEEIYPGGKFDAKKAKDAYYTLMKYHGMPIGGMLETDDFWVSDFALNDFFKLGMGGIFYVNDLEHKYFGHDIFLLPGQMLVEHRHNAVEGGASKMETWQIRHGSAYFFYEGEPQGECPVKVPEGQDVNAKGWKLLKVGEIGHLTELGSWHFIIAGPEGVIITEYATPHYDGSLEFSNPKVVF